MASFYRDRAFATYCNIDISDAFLHYKDIDRKGDCLAAACKSRQSRQNHDRGCDRDSLLGIAESISVASYNHHSYASHVHRQCDFVACGTGLESERTEYLDYRIESVFLACASDKPFVTTDTEHGRKRTSE